MNSLKFLIIFLIFYIANINAQGTCGGRELDHPTSVDAWKCVGMLKQQDGYTVNASSGKCHCQRTGPLDSDGLWNEMNQCTGVGVNRPSGHSVYVHSEGSGCDGYCKGIACWCYKIMFKR
ncbi:unnamed protein product [Cunninghamella echinulata]